MTDFTHSVPISHKDVAVRRFFLKDGQMFVTDGTLKNLWWVLDGTTIGYGDLRTEDIRRIHRKLDDKEVFIGWSTNNEGSQEATNDPIVHITNKEILYPRRERREV